MGHDADTVLICVYQIRGSNRGAADFDGLAESLYVDIGVGDLDAAREEMKADLAAFVIALRRVDTVGAHRRAPGARGAPLAECDTQVRRSIARLGDRIDALSSLQVWNEALDAAPWRGAETWVHGDLLPGNLLVVDGRLSAVIDFGGLNVGDPACDLQPAWNVFTCASRSRFRSELDVDEDSWSRGRGWVVYQTVSALAYYWDTNPGIVRQATRALAQVLAEHTA